MTPPLNYISQSKLLILIILSITLLSCNGNQKTALQKSPKIDYYALKSTKNIAIDSLYKEVLLEVDDTLKVNDLISIYKLSIRNRPIRTDVLDEAFRISKELDYNTGIAICLNRYGLSARYAYDYIEAVKFHKKAIPYYENSWNLKSKVRNFNSLGVAYRRLNIEDEATKYYFKALRLAEKLNDKKSMAIAMNGIGNALLDVKKYDESIEYFNLGEVYMYKKDFDRAYDYHQKSLEIAKEINYKDNEAIIYNTLGQLFKLKGDDEMSIFYYEKAIPILEKYHSKRYLANSKINLGASQKNRLKYADAEKNMNSGLALAKKIGSKENIILGNEELSDLYQKKGDYKKAIEAYKLMVVYRDSMLNEQSENMISARRIKYELEQKEQKIKQLILESKVQKSKIINQFLVIGLLSTIGVFFIVFYRMRTTRKNLEINNMRLKIEEYLTQLSEYKEKDCDAKQENFMVGIKEYGLSEREEEVLKNIAKGMKNQEIADAMFVSLSTIKTHTKNIFEKLDVRNRIEAAKKVHAL